MNAIIDTLIFLLVAVNLYSCCLHMESGTKAERWTYGILACFYLAIGDVLTIYLLRTHV